MQPLTKVPMISSSSGGWMRVWVEFDAANDVWTIRHEECGLDSVEQVSDWTTQLRRSLGALEGKAVIFVDMRGFRLDPALATHYGRVAKAVVGEHASMVFRYGHPDGMTLSSVRLQSIIKRFSANIFKDRAAALAALEHVRAAEGEG